MIRSILLLLIIASTARAGITSPDRVVLLNGCAAEVICALGCEDRVVGVANEILRRSELKKLSDKPPVGRWNSPSLERIASLRPDLVIAYRRLPDSRLEEGLKPLGIRVLRIDCYKLDKLEEDIRRLGELFGEEERADELIRFIRSHLDKVRAGLKRLPPERRVRVYVESYSDYVSVARGSGGAQMCEAAGGINIAADQPVPYPRVSSEWVVGRNPQVIVKAVSRGRVEVGYGVEDASSLRELWREIVSRPGWGMIEAVKRGRVYLIASDIWAGPRAFVGVCYMARWFYPELFGDLDPEKAHREYLRRFLGVELKGIFVYEGG